MKFGAKPAQFGFNKKPQNCSTIYKLKLVENENKLFNNVAFSKFFWKFFLLFQKFVFRTDLNSSRFFATASIKLS